MPITVSSSSPLSLHAVATATASSTSRALLGLLLLFWLDAATMHRCCQAAASSFAGIRRSVLVPQQICRHQSSSSSAYTTTAFFACGSWRRGTKKLTRTHQRVSLTTTTQNPASTTTTRLYSATPPAAQNNMPPRLMATGEEMMDALSNGGRQTLIGNDIPLAMEALLSADVVCFDVDSTVIQEEGIDVLADYLGQGPAVAALTKQAMEGGLKFQDALAARLDLLQPSRQDIENCLRDRPLQITPHIEEFMEVLHDAGKQVYLVSGGFRIMIEPVAERLNIPIFNIVANTLHFDDDDTGKYRGFDPNEPTSQDMGKPRAVQQILDQDRSFQTAVMIGDGATDAQAKPPAAAFVGFGGVVVREKVRAASDWFVTDFADLVRLFHQFPPLR